VNAGELGFAVWRGRPRAGHRVHVHHDVEVNFLFGGSVSYVLGGRRVAMEAGRLHLFWATVPHQIVSVASGTEMGWIVLPVTWLWRWGMETGRVAAMLEGRVLADADPAPEDAGAIARWAKMHEARDARWRRIAELEIEARFRRMMLLGVHTLGAQAPGPQAPSSPAQAPAPLAAVETMAAFITAHYAEPLTVAEVAKAAKLHPAHAMRLFRRYMGMTMVDYLTRQRVAEAQRRLMSGGDPVMNVGMDCGFGSASRFHQAFRRLTGTTPARFRREAKKGVRSI